MHWPKFVAILCFSLWSGLLFGRGLKSLELADGSRIPIDNFLRNAQLSAQSEDLSLVRASFENSQAAALLLIHNNPTPEQPADLLSAMLGVSVVLERIGDTDITDGSEPHRILAPIFLRDQLVLILRRGSSQGPGVVYVLLGERDDFYRLSPSFQRFYDRFQPSLGQKYASRPKPVWIIAALVLLILNTAVIWFGIRRMSGLQRIEE